MLKPGDRAPAFHLQPVFGLPVDLDALVAKTPVVVVFLRPVTATQTRLAVDTLHELLPRLDAEAIPLVAFLRGNHDAVFDFVPRYHVRFRCIWDRTGEWYDAYDVQHDKLYMGTLKSLRPAALANAVAALAEGRAGIGPGNNLLPAEFVVGAGRTVRYARYGEGILHQPDIEALWEACQSS